MSYNKISRIVAALIMAILAAFVVQIMDAQDYHLTREAYLAKQATEFDQEVAHPRFFAGYLLLGLIGSFMYFGVYELLSFCVRKIFEKVKADDDDA